MDEGDGGYFCASCKISVVNTNCTTALSFFSKWIIHDNIIQDV